ncbi:MAG: hypothetical protein KDD85_02550 [Parvularculaceae bacterium]|nr:hypothetical protein [Parvularculaceae bacterium]
MSEFEYWRLCDQLSLVQAALLMSGHDPSNIEHEVERRAFAKQPPGYAACRQALIAAIETKCLRGYLDYDEGCDINGNSYSSLDAERSYVLTEGIGDWLFNRGVRSNFFLPESEAPKEYLDPANERFAPKLAAAIRAWEAVGDDRTIKGTPKQRLEKWLRLHAPEYGLTQKDGKPNESAIQQIAKIANWNLRGGAPTTLATQPPANANVVGKTAKVFKLKKHAANSGGASFELDDEIPF